ncbi:MAG: hypothetical protein K2M59_03850 [Muribaculaceae bacterium]|nr:hypothetical protein [Muribaculaceae bacterium]MDE7465544.1 hypothetical protein [Muribaculaceae bacterium]
MSDNKSTGGVRGSGYTSTAQQASQTIRQVISDLNKDSFSTQTPFPIGRLENEVVSYAREQGIDIADGKITMTVKQITHTLRQSKAEKGKGVSKEHLIEFPIRRNKMVIYHDSSNHSFIYFDRDRNEKFVVRTNYSLKDRNGRRKVVNYITASKTNPREFGLQKYTKIR